MKKTKLTAAFILLLSATLWGQKYSVTFIDNDVDKAFAMAEAQDKIIFIDAYTTWCGPCKMMDKQVFTDEKLGSFFNENFVNLKLDMEKGKGVEFAKKYKVKAYPSFLFLNAAGALLYRSVGFQPTEKFLSVAQEALDPKNHISNMESAYKGGERSVDLLYNYTKALLNAQDDKAQTVGREYLETQESWNDRKTLSIVSQMVKEYDDEYYRYMVEKRHLFIREFGEGSIDGFLQSYIQRKLYQEVENLDLDMAKNIYTKTFPTSKAVPYYDQFEMNYYDNVGNKGLYIEKAQAYVKNYPSLSWSTLNSIAWNFYEKIDDKRALRKAVKWAKKSVTLDSNSFNNDTLAALYYKLGKKKQALKSANVAVELAQAAGQDYSETTKLIEKIVQLN